MLVEYQSFKKEKEKNHFVMTSWIQNKIKVDEDTYDIVSVFLNGKMYPYVKIEENKMMEKKEKENKIRFINRPNVKNELKNKRFIFDTISYDIKGIGPKAIWAKKNENSQAEFFYYNTLIGEYLLEKLYNIGNEIIL